ncbi:MULTISPECIES: phosphopantetheine-binding protein [Olsenella]|uniref:phosphopantetheine-binding protein n=1 Tax=Olsenella TaxID=133925 RepID=UPI00071C8938|nr:MULTISPECIES: phosphopantetheine-binding protein [Olsenella]OFK24597.1 phosphopantetheine-binding protein [Olsenella sp. HMSC062G07]
MDHDAILDKVIELTAEQLELDPTSLGERSEFKALGADSFDLLELVSAFEDEFAATLDDEGLQSIVTIADAVAAIEAARA